MGDWLIMVRPLSPWLILVCYLFNTIGFAIPAVLIDEKGWISRNAFKLLGQITCFIYSALFLRQIVEILSGDLITPSPNGIGFVHLLVSALIIIGAPFGLYEHRRRVTKKLAKWFPVTYVRLQVWLNRRLVKTLRQQTRNLGFDINALEACKKSIETFGQDRDKQDALRTFLTEARERLKLLKKARENDDPMNLYVRSDPPYSYTPAHLSKASVIQTELHKLLTPVETSDKNTPTYGGKDLNDTLQEKLESWFIRNTETVCGVTLPRTEEDHLIKDHKKHEAALQEQAAQAR